MPVLPSSLPLSSLSSSLFNDDWSVNVVVDLDPLIAKSGSTRVAQWMEFVSSRLVGIQMLFLHFQFTFDGNEQLKSSTEDMLMCSVLPQHKDNFSFLKTKFDNNAIVIRLTYDANHPAMDTKVFKNFAFFDFHLQPRDDLVGLYFKYPQIQQDFATHMLLDVLDVHAVFQKLMKLPHVKTSDVLRMMRHIKQLFPKRC
eukprot:CAMPEP_0113848416 /NCGR_PEP_ID=MMETSP0372-20130328/2465_1 /TAXON_ID=340204 /ORGANISM="Lankesteria abbotti" /LENGTH=197 /DNA_ID=CAMNT_0000817897 /DNA_START=123 /DNA_END=716 /DNA_ORIENTATION=+ /assembly_acc=CAM_ASM_000359